MSDLTYHDAVQPIVLLPWRDLTAVVVSCRHTNHASTHNTLARRRGGTNQSASADVDQLHVSLLGRDSADNLVEKLT